MKRKQKNAKKKKIDKKAKKIPHKRNRKKL